MVDAMSSRHQRSKRAGTEREMEERREDGTNLFDPSDESVDELCKNEK